MIMSPILRNATFLQVGGAQLREHKCTTGNKRKELADDVHT